jgi:hypothetical protein
MKDKKQNRVERFVIRLTPDERKELYKRANELNITATSLARMLMLSGSKIIEN